MDILKDYEVWNELTKRYDKKPSRWHEVEYRTPRGYYDLLFFSPDYAALLKQDTIYSANPIVIGLWIEEPEFHEIVFKDKTTAARILQILPYGMRKVPIGPVMKKIKRMIEEEEDPARIFDSAVNMFIMARESAKRASPVAFRKSRQAMMINLETEEDVDTMFLPDVLTGPHVSIPLDVLSKEHRKLIERLDNELTSMIRKKYSMYI